LTQRYGSVINPKVVTMLNARPRRSALYLPASNARAIDKAKQLTCDVVLFDLEDAVSPDAKPIARTQACQAVESRDFGAKELVIRVNGVNTPWFADDLRCAVSAQPDAILLPKVEQVAQVHEVAAALDSIVDPQRRILVWCMLETPRGVLAADAIAGAHPRVDCLVMGTSDLTSDLRAQHTSNRAPLLASLGLCVLAARANGKSVLDGVFLDLSSDDAFRTACMQGREFGFDGKTLIHPKQITSCNEVFSPSSTELAKARAVIEAFGRARAEGRGVAVLDGRLVEELHVREAERTLSLAQAIGLAQCEPL
jgi:citrate lyase subunit beta/citryl-CoA lyase